MRQQPKVLRLQALAHGAQRDRPGDQENRRAHRNGEDAQRKVGFPRTAKQADHCDDGPRRHADRGGRDAAEFDLLMGLIVVQAQEQGVFNYSSAQIYARPLSIQYISA